MTTEKRISLWSGPRNVSTALMYSFAQRPDTLVMDEPLYGHYLKVSGAHHPGREEVLNHMETDLKEVIPQLTETHYEKPFLFIKNMAHHLLEADRKFLNRLTNILLVRDPREMLPSLVNQITQPKMLDTALQMQWELYLELKEAGTPPLVIDSKELLLNPVKILKAVCKGMDIPYYSQMTSWEPGARPEDGIWAKHWYHNVHRSSGFATYSPKNEEVREDLLPLLKECQEYYRKLYEVALKA